MKIIIGASGKLARHIVPELRKSGEEILTFDRNDTVRWLEQPEILAPSDDVVILNCAAKTNTRFCEEHRLESFSDNAGLADRVATVCQKKGYKHIYLSSEVVFGSNDFRNVPSEHCRPHPYTWYGATKHMGELVTLNAGGMVIRLPMLVNLNDQLTVLGQLYKKLKEGHEVQASTCCYSTPITYHEAAIGITDIISKRMYDHEPIIHVAGEAYMSIYDIVEGAAIRDGLNTSLIRVLQHRPEDVALLLTCGGLTSQIVCPIKSCIKAKGEIGNV